MNPSNVKKKKSSKELNTIDSKATNIYIYIHTYNLSKNRYNGIILKFTGYYR